MGVESFSSRVGSRTLMAVEVDLKKSTKLKKKNATSTEAVL